MRVPVLPQKQSLVPIEKLVGKDKAAELRVSAGKGLVLKKKVKPFAGHVACSGSHGGSLRCLGAGHVGPEHQPAPRLRPQDPVLDHGIPHSPRSDVPSMAKGLLGRGPALRGGNYPESEPDSPNKGVCMQACSHAGGQGHVAASGLAREGRMWPMRLHATRHACMVLAGVGATSPFKAAAKPKPTAADGSKPVDTNISLPYVK
jgi:hypothetical protein